jgi:hypothetical protein
MMSRVSKRELLAELRPRYQKAGPTEKQRILDELVATTGYHRKYAIQMLNHTPRPPSRPWRGKPKYDGRVVAALEHCWQAANGICGKRLVPVLPEYVAALERHGELVLDDQACVVVQLSAAGDHLLVRVRASPRPLTPPGTLLKRGSHLCRLG